MFSHETRNMPCNLDGCARARAGFRLDPAEQLERVHQELSSLHQVHAADPILGVDFEEEESVSCTLPEIDVSMREQSFT